MVDKAKLARIERGKIAYEALPTVKRLLGEFQEKALCDLVNGFKGGKATHETLLAQVAVLYACKTILDSLELDISQGKTV